MSASVLIIEDDPALLRGLKDNFAMRGYDVTTATNGAAGLAAALHQPPDLLLLDIMLPGMHGYEVCQRLRKHGLAMPIIMLTAKGQEEDIVMGLELGADDYVTKPFSIRELMARARAFIRRGQSATATDTAPRFLEFGDFQLDTSAHQLLRNGQVVPLTTKEYQLLKLFLTRPDRALTRAEIIRQVWGSGVIVTSRSVDRCVTTLRSKIEENSQRPRFVITIRDVGYRFCSGDAEPSAETQ